MGYKLITSDNFSSIPGLKTWLDGRYNYIVHESNSNYIKFWNDLSTKQNNFGASRVIRSPEINTPFIMFQGRDGLIVSLDSQLRDFNFMHNGQPFGIYCIVNWSWYTGLTHSILTTGGSSGNGIQLLIQGSISNGRVSIIVRNEGQQARSAAISNLNPGFPNEIDPTETRIFSHLFLGHGVNNNQIMRLGTMENISNANGDIGYSSANNSTFVLGATSNEEHYLNIGLILIYDWTGFSTEQVVNFDNRITGLLEVHKLDYM